MLDKPIESLPLWSANPNHARSHNQEQKTSAKSLHKKCAKPRAEVRKIERDNSTSEMDKNELLDVYLYPSCVAWLGLPADLGFLFFSFLFSFFSLTWPHKQGSLQWGKASLCFLWLGTLPRALVQ